MNLICMMPVRNELDRYLRQTVTAALTYCDEVRVLDDGSDDGSFEWLAEQDRVAVKRSPVPSSWDRHGGHEGRTRQALWDWVLAAKPTHVLCLDADELVPRGVDLRETMAVGGAFGIWALRIVEVWQRDPCMIRMDAGWHPRFAPLAFKVPAVDRLGRRWRCRRDLRLACPRHPIAVSDGFAAGRAHRMGRVDVAHLGWMDPATRERRCARYQDLDGGRYHNAAHIDSILDEKQWRLRPYDPTNLAQLDLADAASAAA